ncbi:hypothetical protein EVAR_35702_1 [Eumeta japonica]|uniref:Uncharacterized protein n=1 Tax=Eumeta variegata TaxID=151549 RepID=A0A4C1VF76_EUMVA|nr:hypothetical protein EVAR_35702_1 [Eumeta japonica]
MLKRGLSLTSKWCRNREQNRDQAKSEFTPCAWAPVAPPYLRHCIESILSMDIRANYHTPRLGYEGGGMKVSSVASRSGKRQSSLRRQILHQSSQPGSKSTSRSILRDQQCGQFGRSRQTQRHTPEFEFVVLLLARKRSLRSSAPSRETPLGEMAA